MMYPLYYYLMGYRTYAVSAEQAASLLELCRRFEWAYDGFRHREDGGISLTFPRPIARRLTKAAEAVGIELISLGGGGMPDLLVRLLHRPGLMVGCLVGLVLYVVATQMVWDIRISGNTTVSDRSIEETLSACGFAVGTSLHDLRADVLENRVLLFDERLSWISVNRRGTVAYVEVREASPTPTPESDAPADLVAAIGGVIQRVELDEGNVRVEAGQAVSPGDVLVSGIYDSQVEGIRLTRARARIYARTVRELTVRIPLTYEQKIYHTDETAEGGGIIQAKYLNFFQNTVMFTKKTGNSEGMYDIIENESDLSLVAGVGFPLSVSTVWYLPYTMTTATRTYDEAEELAYIELSRQIAAIPGGAEVLSKTITIHRSPDALLLQCTLHAVEDIGTVREIYTGRLS